MSMKDISKAEREMININNMQRDPQINKENTN